MDKAQQMEQEREAYHQDYRAQPQKDRQHHLNEDIFQWCYRELIRSCWSVQ